MKADIFHFMKVGQEEHIQDFFENGTIYMNSVSYFRKIEDQDKERGDRHEGAAKLLQGKYLKITTSDGTEFQFGTEGTPIKLLSSQLYQWEDSGDGYIFCLTAFHTDYIKTNAFNDPRFRQFGPKVVLINNPKEFLNRVKAKLDELGLCYKYGLVSYYDHLTYSGKLNPFRKEKDRFEYQGEFRVFVESDTKDYYKFSIGRLDDIAVVKSSNIIGTMFFTPS